MSNIPSPVEATPLAETDRTKLRRHPERGHFDRDTANAIIDASYVAHVGFVVDGEPRVLPMTYGRDGETLYLHGAVGNAMLRGSAGLPVCVTITLLDGLVLARSAFHHSMNYRSVVLVGTAERVDDETEKLRAFDVIVDHVVPARSQQARPSDASESRKTLVLRVPISEGSAKIRDAGVGDDDADLDLPVWAGVVPLGLVPGEPIQDPLQASSDDASLRSLTPPPIGRR